MYEANGTRASDQGPDAGRFDNSANIRALLRLRAEQAMALGFAEPVERSLATKMAPGAQEFVNKRRINKQGKASKQTTKGF